MVRHLHLQGKYALIVGTSRSVLVLALRVPPVVGLGDVGSRPSIVFD